MTGTALATQQPSFVTAQTAKPIIPGTFDSVWEMSALIAASGMAPKDMKSREQIAVAIFHGLEIGLTPMAALQSIAVINGRPSIWGDGAMALVRSNPLCEYVKEWSEGDGESEVAYCETKRKNGEVVKRKFSHADAKAANLLSKDGPWKNYRSRMMQMRARAWCLRDAYADVFRGLAIAEEMQDVQMKDVTPQPPAPPTDEPEKVEQKAPPVPPAEEKRADPPVPPSAEERRDPPVEQTKRERTIDADPFDAYAAEFESAMAKAGSIDELKAVWGTRDRNLSEDKADRLTAIKGKHKARIEGAQQAAEDDAEAFDPSAFKADIMERLAAAQSADDAQQLLDEVDGAVEAGKLSEADKEAHFTDAFSEVFERFA